jgi:hypothetical protein
MPASIVWPVRLPGVCVAKLEELSALAHKPRAQVLRALILNATPALLPKAWLTVDPDELAVIRTAERLDSIE